MNPRPEQPPVSRGTSMWAVLVGIDDYQTVSPLRGCVNDVEAMRQFLVNQLGVPDDHIRILTNQQATRSGILRTFLTFLIENRDIVRGDQILFHYSGHGSQMPDTTHTEPDGLNETLVPHDSRTPGVYDLPDKTLAALLDRLAAEKGDHITVILDSCHSGSGTRRIEGSGLARVRRIPADDRLPPADLDADLRAGTTARGAGASGWSFQAVPYVLLAGCRDRELSNEYRVATPSAEVWHGALTYFTLEALRQLTPNTTYAELHERVTAQVNALYPSQTPQCEGDRDRVVFGGRRVQRDAFLVVQQVAGDTVILGAGLVHGLREGTKLALYPRSVTTRDHLPRPLATAEVLSVSATTARARLSGAPAAVDLLHARALITEHVYGGLRKTVALAAGAGSADRRAIEQLREAIEHTAPGDKPSPYLEVVPDAAQSAALRVEAAGGKLSIYGTHGELLVVPADITGQGADVTSVRDSLESIARFRTILSLANEESGSELVGKLKVRLRRLVPGPDGPRTEDLPPQAVSPGGEQTLYYEPDPVHKDRNYYVVELINESALAVFPHIFVLSPDYSIHRLYPELGQEEALQPGRTLLCGVPGSGGRALEIYLPNDPPWDSSRDTIKVIATLAATDLRWLNQKGLNVSPREATRSVRSVQSPLDQLLDTVISGSGSRFGRPARPSGREDWATAELAFTVVRRYQRMHLDTPAQRVSLGDGITMVKPRGFTGAVTVAAWGQATRGADGDPGLKPPPGLQAFPDLFRPVGRAGTRSIGPSALLLAFDVDEPSRTSVTPENPLRFELPDVPGEEVSDLLPVAFDGEDYLLVGCAGDVPNTVDVVRLPPAVVAYDAQGLPTTRGIARTIRLFIYKKIGRPTTLTGLRNGQFMDGKVVYTPVQRTQFRTGQNVALFVHGIVSDTRWMIEGPARFVRGEVVPYDHVLAWDYESFGTPIEKNGALLAEALQRECGFGPNDGITLHVYAHSMGSLVSRSMIELFGGHRFVDRLVVAGPPNRGSVLANLTQGVAFLVNTLINYYAGISPLGVVNWLAGQLFKQGVGLSDLKVDSAILERLNSLSEPATVPYLVLAGRNVPDEEQLRRLTRIAKKVLNRTLQEIFGEENDIAVGTSSMQSVRGGRYPHLTVQVVPCDHFHYFVNPAAREAIRSWIIGQSVG